MAHQNRIVQIDTLRGAMLLIMTIDHLLLWPFRSLNYLYAYTNQSFGYFSAAEGFFFLSGIASGLVFSPYMSNHHILSSKVFERTKKLYLANTLSFGCLCLAIFLVPSFFIQLEANPWVLEIYRNPLSYLWLSTLFLGQAPLFDILPLYCLFFLALPSVFWLIKRKQIPLLLCLSCALWLVGQLHPLQYVSALLKSYNNLIILFWFDPCAWQILFVLGVSLGYLGTKTDGLSFLLRPPKVLVFFAFCLCVFLFLLRHTILELSSISLINLTDASVLGPVRLANFLLFSWLLLLLATRYPALFCAPSLALLGRYSLSVFVYHNVLCYLLGAYMLSIDGLVKTASLLLLAISLVSVWVVPVVMTWFKGNMKMSLSIAWLKQVRARGRSNNII